MRPRISTGVADEKSLIKKRDKSVICRCTSDMRAEFRFAAFPFPTIWLCLACGLGGAAMGVEVAQQIEPSSSLVFFSNDNRVAEFSLTDALERGDYEKLEDLAFHLRESKERFINGTWKLSSFYTNLTQLPR